MSRWLLALVRLPSLIQRGLRAWYTLEPSDWSSLADTWQDVVAAFPRSLVVRSLHARLLRSARRLPAAIAAGEEVIRIAPTNASAYLQQGKALRASGDRPAAIASFVAAWHHGERQAATRELCRYGARSALPEPQTGIYDLRHYDDFAASASPPPAPPAKSLVLFEVLLTGSEPDVADTRASLARQTYPHWRAVPSFGLGDSTDKPIFNISLSAGVRLDPQAFAWLAWTIAETDCGTVRADHDLLGPDGTTRAAPVLFPRLDRFWAHYARPAIVAHRADSSGLVVNVPLVLASCPAPAESQPPVASPTPCGTANVISVVIPTRDNPQMLRAAIDALRSTAAAPANLEIVVVDNGSKDAEATALLAKLSSEPDIVVVPFDAPFNWSRANRLGAGAARGALLLFLNDDTEMLTSGWDHILRGLLEKPQIGVVGARMLYPNGTIQHAGFVFGMDNGPQHEGRWMPGSDLGPDGRWEATREAVAVTGAFIAVRKADFESIDGFDDVNFAVDFADVDFCLRIRALGQAVVYCGAVSVLHHESVSRGLNLSRAKRTRMRREAATLRKRWGEAIDRDPFYPPAWSRTGCSFDGLTALSQAAVIDYVMRYRISETLDTDQTAKMGL